MKALLAQKALDSCSTPTSSPPRSFVDPDQTSAHSEVKVKYRTANSDRPCPESLSRSVTANIEMNRGDNFARPAPRGEDQAPDVQAPSGVILMANPTSTIGQRHWL